MNNSALPTIASEHASGGAQNTSDKKNLGSKQTVGYTLDHFPINDIHRIYNKIKKRKNERISEIENIVTPLLSEHPELARVINILQELKPKGTVEACDESIDISQS